MIAFPNLGNMLISSNTVATAIRRFFGSDWNVEVSTPARTVKYDYKAIVKRPDSEPVVFNVEVKSAVQARHAQDLQQRLSDIDGTPLVILDFISAAAKETLRKNGLNYIEETGNAHIRVTTPLIFINSEGAQRNPEPDSRSIRSLTGTTSARVVRYLCDHVPPYGVRTIATAIGRHPGNVSRITDFLSNNALIEKRAGTIISVAWRPLIERWAIDLAKRRIVGRFLEPRGVSQFLNDLRSNMPDFVLTGQVAAAACRPDDKRFETCVLEAAPR